MAHSTYSAEFKAKVVLEVIRGERGLDEIAQENKLNPNMIRNWKKEFEANASRAFEGNRSEKEARRKEIALEKKLNRQYQTIGQLTVERDFLQDCFRQVGREVPQLDKA